MERFISEITLLLSGVFAQPDLNPDTFYLQASHFRNDFSLDVKVKPLVRKTEKFNRHILQDDDILFAAKGLNNFAVCYNQSLGQSVASSSFIIIRITETYKSKILPEYLCWFINSSDQIKVFHKEKATTTVPSISIGQLSQLSVPTPSIITQKLIVRLQEIRNKEKVLLQMIQEKKNLHLKKILFTASHTPNNE